MVTANAQAGAHVAPEGEGGSPRTMRAVIQTGYGSVERLELRDVELPVPEPHQALVRVHAASINPVEWYRTAGPLFARLGEGPKGLRRPKTPRIGVDVAGRVEAVGAEVTEFQPGDEVFGTTAGSWAELACAREVRLVRKPENVSFEEAAAAPVAGITALQALRDRARVEPGQKVLINGASGGVGTFAVQIAKSLEADVTAVCSTKHVELVRSLGADRVCDYTKEDFTKLGVRHDAMLDIAGSRAFSDFRRVLTRNAAVVLVGGPMNAGLGPLPHTVATRLASVGRSQTVGFFLSRISKDDLLVLADLLATGRVRSVIDRRYGLDQVHEAYRYFGEGHAKGKVVLLPNG